MCEFVGMRDLASAGTSVGSEAQNGLRGLHSLCASDRFDSAGAVLFVRSLALSS